MIIVLIVPDDIHLILLLTDVLGNFSCLNSKSSFPLERVLEVLRLAIGKRLLSH